MLSYILPLIPINGCYIEPFCGGASVLFAKKRSQNEILNDNNDDLINFYRILKNKEQSKKLITMCKSSLYSRSIHTQARSLFQTGTEIEKAWALWYKINTGFSGKLDGGFSITRMTNSSHAMRLTNLKNNLQYICKRLEEVQIENINAVDCINNYDADHVFFYLDPPYLRADQGHYKGYTEEDFIKLLEILSEIKGKFLLSCYPGPEIESYIGKNKNWNIFTIKQRIRAVNKSVKKETNKKFKTEMLTWNYDKTLIQQPELFVD